jgi:hypothetical protein
MALISCSECGKQVSDKASSCPNCGNPMTTPRINVIQNQPILSAQKEESLMGCPKCNSTQLSANKRGFSAGNALAGAILTGGVGLLAGGIGSSNVSITCLKCGFKYKAGEYETLKNRQKALAESRVNNSSSGSGLFIFTILLTIVTIILAKLTHYTITHTWWSFIVVILGLATLASLALLLFIIYETIEFKKIYNSYIVPIISKSIAKKDTDVVLNSMDEKENKPDNKAELFLEKGKELYGNLIFDEVLKELDKNTNRFSNDEISFEEFSKQSDFLHKLSNAYFDRKKQLEKDLDLYDEQLKLNFIGNEEYHKKFSQNMKLRNQVWKKDTVNDILKYLSSD